MRLLNSLAVMLVVATAPSLVCAQTQEAHTLQRSITVLDDTMSLTVQAIPHALLANAQAIALVPDVVKVGLVVGGRHGRGVVVARDDAGNWSQPTFIEMSGGSVGWQIGVQRTDVVLVFKNKTGVQDILAGRKFTLGADASVAAGPVGRQAEAATDEQLKSEVYSYSRSRGLFAGVALGGSVISVDNNANGAFYRPGEPLPMAAQSLLGRLSQLSAPPMNLGVPGGVPMQGALEAPAPGVSPADFRQPQVNLAVEIERTREALIGSHTKLTMNLDPTWRGYLILPDAMYKDPRGLSVQGMQEVLNRYDRVAGDARYDKLVAMQEFQQVHELLGRYLVQMREMSAGPIALPPPPGK